MDSRLKKDFPHIFIEISDETETLYYSKFASGVNCVLSRSEVQFSKQFYHLAGQAVSYLDQYDQQYHRNYEIPHKIKCGISDIVLFLCE